MGGSESNEMRRVGYGDMTKLEQSVLRVDKLVKSLVVKNVDKF